jgi:hypothetical protein
MTFFAEHFLELRDGLIGPPPTRFNTGCMLFGYPLGNVRLDLIVFELKSTTTSLGGIGSANSAIFMRPIQRITSCSGAPSITRLEDGFTASFRESQNSIFFGQEMLGLVHGRGPWI